MNYKSLTPWRVPNELLLEFCKNAKVIGQIHIETIVRHDNNNYCVVLNGSYPFIEDQLKMILGIEL